jgi:hypothetical protein
MPEITDYLLLFLRGKYPFKDIKEVSFDLGRMPLAGADL